MEKIKLETEQYQIKTVENPKVYEITDQGDKLVEALEAGKKYIVYIK